MKSFGKALLASAVALACSAGTAAAQSDGFVFFGDSLTDAGSYKPVLPPGTGRFTTNPDPVWAQLIGERYGFTITPANQGGTDYAQGGARVTGSPGYPAQPPTGAGQPMASQVAQYIGQGVNQNAIHAMWAGNNDIFLQLERVQAGQITPEQAQAAVVLAATQYVQQVAALQAAGARTVAVFNLADIGKTPYGVDSGPAVSGQISAIVGLYNSTVQTGLTAVGGNVIRVDIFRIFNEVLANPGAFGFTNTTARACGATTSLLCTPADLVAPNANRTYVYADDVHASGGTHAVLAQILASYLEGPSSAATLTEGPLAVEQATFRTVDARMWSAMDTPYDPKRGMTFWAAYDYANPDVDMGYASGDADLSTLSVGGDIRLSQHLLAGAAANFSQFDASYSGGGHKLDEVSATIYAGWGSGPWYAGFSAIVGNLDYSDVHRSFDVGVTQRSESGDTSGTHWGLRVHGGYWLRAGSVNHGPFAKLVWQRADVNAFSETSGSSTGLGYGEQTRKSLISSLGWQAQGTWGAVRPFGRVTWEYEFKDDARDVTVSPPGGGSYTMSVGKPDDNWALFNAGVATDFGSGAGSLGKVTGYLMGTATAGKSDGDSWALTVGMRVPF